MRENVKLASCQGVRVAKRRGTNRFKRSGGRLLSLGYNWSKGSEGSGTAPHGTAVVAMGPGSQATRPSVGGRKSQLSEISFLPGEAGF